MKKKQTVVEFFWNEISDVLPFSVDSITAIKIYEIIQQAKEMEKLQILKAKKEGYDFATSEAIKEIYKNYKQ